MKPTLRKLLTCLLILSLAASVFAGCGSAAGSTATQTAQGESAADSADTADSADSAEGSETDAADATVFYASAISTYTVSDNDTSEAFDSFLDDLFASEVTSNSIDFHYCIESPEDYGLSMDTVTFGTTAWSDLDASQSATKELYSELLSFSYDELSESQQFIYDLLLDTLEESLESFDYYLYQTIFSPTTGIQAQLPILLSEYTFRSQEDVDDYILLLYDVPSYFAQLLEIEEAKSEAGLFMADFTADAVIEQCEEFIADPDANLLIEMFEEKLDTELPDLDEDTRAAYIEANTEAVLEAVIPAYQTVIDTLTALKGTGSNEGGLAGFEEGTVYYSLLAAAETGSAKTVEEMIALTEEQLTTDLRIIYSAYAQDADIYTKLTSVTPSSTDPQTLLESLQESILTEFPAAVSSVFTIKYVHESLQESLSPAFYIVPAVDAADSNTIYINSYYVNDEDALDLYTTLAHEGYPGHLYQTTWFYSTNPHPIRKILSCSGYTEGWATYVEMMSFSWICEDALTAEVLAANQDFSLGICARVDMGVNYEGWDRQDTAEFLALYGLDDEDTVTWLFEAVVAEPASYLSYYIGYLEFEELRAEAEETLGDAFDAVEFHTFILTTGTSTFSLLHEQMEEWMEDTLNAENAAS